MKKTKKRAKREVRVLIVALIVASLIAAGSTFAWFTSQDEVTNRLSASQNYNVSIAEDFQSPEDWVPGHTINKDVSAVNAGNVDAFVRMWLEGEMRVVNKMPYDSSAAASGFGSITLTDTTKGDVMDDLGYKYQDNDKCYYKVLSTYQKQNPLDPDDSNTNNTDNQPAYFSEVQSVQAGNYLAYAPAGASWYYVTEQQETIVNADGQTVVVPADKKVGTDLQISGLHAKIDGAPCKIDSDTFVPQTNGLYIFMRTIDYVNQYEPIESINGDDNYEFSGYYYKDGVYYALRPTDNPASSEYVFQSRNDPAARKAVTITTGTATNAPVVNVDESKIKMYNANEVTIKNDGLTWTYTPANNTDPAKLTATYAGVNSTSSTDNIIIDVTLANIGTNGQTWTHFAGAAAITGSNPTPARMDTFYYNDDVEAGDTTTKLVDSVTLNQAVTKDAYIAFDFDLNVFLQSVQVTFDQNGNELTTAVEGEWASDGAAAPAAATHQAAAEIADIAWAASGTGG